MMQDYATMDVDCQNEVTRCSPTASTRTRREYRAGHIAWTSRITENGSISPITLVGEIDCSQVQPASTMSILIVSHSIFPTLHACTGRGTL